MLSWQAPFWLHRLSGHVTACPGINAWHSGLPAITLPGKKLTGEGLEIKPTDNMKMLRAWAADPKVIKATRVDVLYGVSNLMDSAVAAIPAVNSRILLLYGEHDDVIPEPPICSLATELTRHHKTLDTRLYPDGYHMLTRDLKADLVLSDMSNWILDKVDSTIVSRQALQCKTSKLNGYRLRTVYHKQGTRSRIQQSAILPFPDKNNTNISRK